MPKRASNKLKSIITKLINGKIKTDSYPLHVYTKSIAYMYQKNYKSARAIVYKEFQILQG